MTTIFFLTVFISNKKKYHTDDFTFIKIKNQNYHGLLFHPYDYKRLFVFTLILLICITE